MRQYYLIFFAVPLLMAPYLVTTNKKGLILHEQNIDHGKIFNRGAADSHCAH